MPNQNIKSRLFASDDDNQSSAKSKPKTDQKTLGNDPITSRRFTEEKPTEEKPSSKTPYPVDDRKPYKPMGPRKFESDTTKSQNVSANQKPQVKPVSPQSVAKPPVKPEIRKVTPPPVASKPQPQKPSPDPRPNIQPPKHQKSNINPGSGSLPNKKPRSRFSDISKNNTKQREVLRPKQVTPPPIKPENKSKPTPPLSSIPVKPKQPAARPGSRPKPFVEPPKVKKEYKVEQIRRDDKVRPPRKQRFGTTPPSNSTSSKKKPFSSFKPSMERPKEPNPITPPLKAESQKKHTPDNKSTYGLKVSLGLLASIVIIFITATVFVYFTQIRPATTKYDQMSSLNANEIENKLSDIEIKNEEQDSKINDIETTLSSFISKEILEPILRTIDSDGDGISDYDELTMYNTDPDKSDTDDDGYSDKDEIDNGYNPNGEGTIDEEEAEDTENNNEEKDDELSNPSISEAFTESYKYEGTLDGDIVSEDYSITVLENGEVLGTFTFTDNGNSVTNSITGEYDYDSNTAEFIINMENTATIDGEEVVYDTTFEGTYDDNSGSLVGELVFSEDITIDSLSDRLSKVDIKITDKKASTKTKTKTPDSDIISTDELLNMLDE